MANQNRRAGTLYVKIDGRQYDVRGNWTYRLGFHKRTGMMGPDRVHGYSETPQIPFIEGEIVDARDVSLEELQNLTESTITLELANSKNIVLRDAWYAADGDVGTEQAGIQARFEGMSAEEISAS